MGVDSQKNSVRKLTKQTAIIVSTGIKKQTNATSRHGINVFKKYTRKNPSVTLTLANPVKIPRIDGSLRIFERY